MVYRDCSFLSLARGTFIGHRCHPKKGKKKKKRYQRKYKVLNSYIRKKERSKKKIYDLKFYLKKKNKVKRSKLRAVISGIGNRQKMEKMQKSQSNSFERITKIIFF